MKILYVITGLTLGGAEKVVCTLADEMVKKGHEVKIAYLKGRVEVQPQSKQIELIELKLNSPLAFFKASSRYKTLITQFKPDVIHAHMVHANIFARLNQLYTGKKFLICSAHNSNEGGALRMLAYKWTDALSNINTNVSCEATEALVKKGAFKSENVCTMYNGVDLNKFNVQPVAKSSLDKKICLSVGRLNVQKDYFNLINAIALLDRKLLSNIEFYIAGEGELRSEIEQHIQALQLNNTIKLLGMRSDIPALLNRTDYFILSSRHEGLPTVLIEAMACQCFVIATDCGGSAEIMGDTGLLVEKENSTELAKALQYAFALDEQVILENNLKARQRVENNFSLPQSVNQWLNLYERK
jgi:glycosyltransferase involved in cell wall biosynthesis